MPHTRSAPWLGAAALLLAPQLALAGPLTWGFRAEAPDGTVLRDVTALSDLVYSDLFLPDPRAAGQPVSETTPGHRFDRWKSEATVTITDGASGQSGEFQLWRGWVREYEVRADGSEELIYEGETGGPWPDAFQLTLGGNRYDVRGPGGELLVNVTPAVATPEPTTLALAAVGLTPLAVRAARRRRMTPCA